MRVHPTNPSSGPSPGGAGAAAVAPQLKRQTSRKDSLITEELGTSRTSMSSELNDAIKKDETHWVQMLAVAMDYCGITLE